MARAWLALLVLALCAVHAATAAAKGAAVSVRGEEEADEDRHYLSHGRDRHADADEDEEGEDEVEEVEHEHDEHEQEQRVPAAPAAAASTTLLEKKSDAEADADLVQSLYKLVKQGTEQDKKLSTELSTEAAQSQALQSDLAVKQQQLQRHQNLMKNLQICLAQGPEALSQTPKPIFMEQHSAQSREDCWTTRQQLADLKLELENSANDGIVYKRQYEKAAKLLTVAQKKLNRYRLAEKQPTKRTLCDKLKSCQRCSAEKGCAWCAHSLGMGGMEKGVGMCRRMDVTARLRGHPKMDGLTAGECEAKDWQTRVSKRMSVLSWNVFSNDLKHARRRARVVFDLIRKTDPTFIAFQEVEDWFLQALRLETWAGTYYQSDFGNGHAPGGLYILSKYPLTRINYNEQTAPGQVQYDMRARVLTANAIITQTPPPPAKRTIPGGRNPPSAARVAGSFVLTLAATNLDWRNADSRSDALDFVFATLSPYDDVILMGDVNFDSNALPETSHVPENWLDVWPALNPDLSGKTWDPDTNPYARASDPTSLPSRIDRIFVKSAQWLPRSIKLVGCSSLDLLCNGLFSQKQPPVRPHALPKPLSQPHAQTEANVPPLRALDKPKHKKRKHKKLPKLPLPLPTPKPTGTSAVLPPLRNPQVGAGRSANSVFLELAAGSEAAIAAATTSWAELDQQAETEADTHNPVYPSNHYALLSQFSRFVPRC